MPDHAAAPLGAAFLSGRLAAGDADPRGKRLADLLISVAILLPALALAAMALAVLMPLSGDRGPLFYAQLRMGRAGRPIRILKFRTMRAAPGGVRRADDPLEVGRITPLGRILRRTRLDELPQVLNVLAGEMSLIGPRPDYLRHALHYARAVPGYRARYAVRPGITGLAQVEMGYAEGSDGARAKLAWDLRYIRARSWTLEARIALQTAQIVLFGRGR